jgi:SAM-dependent methyltransferase
MCIRLRVSGLGDYQMVVWKVVKRLWLNQSTLARALGEIQLSDLLENVVCGREVSAVLVAGGGKRGGSESVLTGRLDNSVRLVYVDMDHTKIPDVEADLTGLWPFKPHSFDLVISMWVVEHLLNPEQFFREAFRVLKRNGALVCGVPFIYRKHGSPSDYWRFTDATLSYMSQLAGFQQVEVRSVGGTPCVTCLSLAWPLVKIRLLGILLVIMAYGFDAMVRSVCRIFGKGHDLVDSYPIHFIAYASK